MKAVGCPAERGNTMFKEERKFNRFTWQSLGDIQTGRPNLGLKVPVVAYRLLQYTLRDVLIAELGLDTANAIFVKAGRLAGKHFCENLLDRKADFNAFVAQLQQVLKEQAIGVLRIEQADLKKMHFTLTVAEDLDCSGLPCTDEVVCDYDEGFIAGILEAYTGKSFVAKEIDCWASGDRVCRFDVRMVEATE
jgi:predicted hydrocarbon binding protein